MTSLTKNVPALRFPEFVTAAPWEWYSLGEIGQLFGGLSGKSAEDFGSGQPFVTYKQVYDKSIIDLTKVGKVRISPDEHQNALNFGDVLFTASSETPEEVGYASVLLNLPEEPIYLNSFCFALRPNNLKELNPYFARYLFHSPIYRHFVTIIAQGTTRYNITKKAFLKLKLPIPSLPEQQKIADCLSTLDDLINAQSEKVDALKDYKKGLLQQLFPVEGEAVPRLRFPDFTASAPWETKKLGEVCDVRDGTHESPKYYESGIPFITSKNLLENGELDFTNITYIAESDANNYNKRSQVNIGDILFGMIGTIGRPVLVKRNDFCIKNMALIKKTALVHNFYILAALSSVSVLSQIDNGSAGNTQKFISLNSLRNLDIPFPTLSEQEKIAGCLSSLDDQIIAASDQLVTLKSHKKGLMQQLFPVIDGF